MDWTSLLFTWVSVIMVPAPMYVAVSQIDEARGSCLCAYSLVGYWVTSGCMLFETQVVVDIPYVNINVLLNAFVHLWCRTLLTRITRQWYSWHPRWWNVSTVWICNEPVFLSVFPHNLMLSQEKFQILDQCSAPVYDHYVVSVAGREEQTTTRPTEQKSLLHSCLLVITLDGLHDHQLRTSEKSCLALCT